MLCCYYQNGSGLAWKKHLSASAAHGKENKSLPRRAGSPIITFTPGLTPVSADVWHSKLWKIPPANTRWQHSELKVSAAWCDTHRKNWVPLQKLKLSSNCHSDLVGKHKTYVLHSAPGYRDQMVSDESHQVRNYQTAGCYFCLSQLEYPFIHYKYIYHTFKLFRPKWLQTINCTSKPVNFPVVGWTLADSILLLWSLLWSWIRNHWETTWLLLFIFRCFLTPP